MLKRKVLTKVHCLCGKHPSIELLTFQKGFLGPLLDNWGQATQEVSLKCSSTAGQPFVACNEKLLLTLAQCFHFPKLSRGSHAEKPWKRNHGDHRVD